MKQTEKLAVIITLITGTAVMAEVTFRTWESDPNWQNVNTKLNFEWTNNSTDDWFLGGARVTTDKPPMGFPINDWAFETLSGSNEYSLIYNSSIATTATIPAGGNIVTSSGQDWSGNQPAKILTYDILLKTGAPGKVDQPVDEDPITVDQIDGIITQPNYYNTDHRYIDTLGFNGGLYSGGIMDTWLGQTQMQVALSKKPYGPIHLTEYPTFGSNGNDQLFWMTTSMGQEYFQVDQQWMLAKGMQETSLAESGNPRPSGYGIWQVSEESAASRTIWYPQLFQNGYNGAMYNTPWYKNSGTVVSQYIYSIACDRAAYDLYMYSSNICWKNIMEVSKDRYFPLAAIMAGYNGGLANAQRLAAKYLYASQYDTQGYADSLNLHASTEIFCSSPGYVNGVVMGVQNLEAGSKDAYLNKSVEILDLPITLSTIQRFFYGENGTVASQGEGGLLHHFNISDRTAFDATISAAFNKLKNRAPSTINTAADDISLRYDWLTLLRTVKTYFKVSWKRPSAAGEWTTAVYNMSKAKVTCGNVAIDTVYPYSSVSKNGDWVESTSDTTFVLEVTGNDNVETDNVKWCINKDWVVWKPASPTGTQTTTTKSFILSVPLKAVTDLYGQGSGTLWFMTEDASGNSVVKSVPIPPFSGNPLESAAAIDKNGDGSADSIRVKIIPASIGAATPNSPDMFMYSWPDSTESTLINVTQNEKNSYANAVFLIDPTNNAGAGLGKIKIRYSSMKSDKYCEIKDSVGPALINQAAFCPSKDGKQPDTVKVQFSEPVKGLSSSAKSQLRVDVQNKNAGRDVISQSASGNNFLFAVGTINPSNDKWVSLIVDGGIVDSTASNRPAPNNQLVPLVDMGVKYPALKSAAAYDANGDGKADSIKIGITKSAANGAFELDQHQKQFTYSWSDTLGNSVPANVQYGTNRISFGQLYDTKGFGIGKITMLYDEMIAPATVAILDSVGPAVVTGSAAYTIPVSGIYTFDFTTSETVKSLVAGNLTDLAKGNSYLEFTADTNIAGTAVRVDSVDLSKISSNVYRFCFNGDSLNRFSYARIIPAGSVVDLVKNSAAANNQWVSFKKLDLNVDPTIVDSAIISNLNTSPANGLADNISVQFKIASSANAFTNSDLKQVIWNWSGIEDTASRTNGKLTVSAPDANKIVTVTISQPTMIGFKNGTGTGVLSFANGVNTTTIPFAIKDSVGPAIVNDTLNAPVIYTLPKIGTMDKHTLDLTVTEDLKTLENTKIYFQFKDRSGKILAAATPSKVESSNNRNWKISFDTDLLTGYDSVQIIASSELKDLAGIGAKGDNQWVPFKRINPNNTPTLLNSVISYGDTVKAKGFGDRITVRVKRADGTDPILPKDLKMIKWNWNGTIDSSLSCDTATSNDTMTFTVKNLNLRGYGSGSGEIQFSKNGQTEVVPFSSIIDSVGPAITTATCFRDATNSGKDTLELILSEPVGTSPAGDQFYRYLSSEYGAQSIVASTMLSGTDTIRVEIATNLFQKFDWINMTSSNGISDLAGNRAHLRNQKVPVTIKGTKVPAICSAEMFDADGDGVVDSIAAKIVLGTDPEADDAFDLTTAQFSWPTSMPLDTAKTISKIDATTLAITQIADSATAGDGQMKLTFPSGTPATKLIDKAGPVVRTARLYENAGNGEDTLLVEFSEIVTSVRATSELLKLDGSPKMTLGVQQVSDKSWILTFDHSAGFAVGKKVSIKDDSSIRDLPGNPAHKNNVEVVIQEIRRAITVNTGASGFFDTDADGTMDALHLAFTKPVEKNGTQERIKDFTVKFNWPVGSLNTITEFTIPSTRMVADSNMIFVDLSKEAVLAGMTFIDPAAFGSITVSQPEDLPTLHFKDTTFVGNDSMAAVPVGYAEYHGVKLTEDLDLFEDTLTVHFSESIADFSPAVDGDSTIFTLKNLKGTYTVNVVNDVVIAGSTATMPVRVKRLSSTIPSIGDSIAVTGNGQILDLTGNIQKQMTQFVPFNTVHLPAEYEVMVYPNPFTVHSGKNNELLESYGIESFEKLAIMVHPFGDRAGERLEGSIAMFDAVGNEIIAAAPMEFREKQGALVYVSEGKNQSGRTLGSGNYQAFISVKSQSGSSVQSDVIPVRIGIKR